MHLAGHYGKPQALALTLQGPAYELYPRTTHVSTKAQQGAFSLSSHESLLFQEQGHEGQSLLPRVGGKATLPMFKSCITQSPEVPPLESTPPRHPLAEDFWGTVLLAVLKPDWAGGRRRSEPPRSLGCMSDPPCYLNTIFWWFNLHN